MDNKIIAENAGGIQAQLHWDYLKPIFEKLSLDILREWQATKITEVNKREKLWLQMLCLNNVEARIQQVIKTGAMAKATIEREQRH